jgi:hypothetical protein
MVECEVYVRAAGAPAGVAALAVTLEAVLPGTWNITILAGMLAMPGVVQA